MITTNKGVQDWPEVLAGDEVLATAILDRLLHRCHVCSTSAAGATGCGARASSSDAADPS